MGMVRRVTRKKSDVVAPAPPLKTGFRGQRDASGEVCSHYYSLADFFKI